MSKLYKSRSATEINNVKLERYYKIKPVRPFRRFLKEPNNGIAPLKLYQDFIKKDMIKPFNRGKLSLYSEPKLKKIHTWALNSDKNCPIEENLPKFQPFKDYHFYKFPRKDAETYRRTFLPTDHIAIKQIEPIDDKGQKSSTKNYPFLKLKSVFNPQSVTKEGWALPQSNKNTLSNKSSVGYNILNFENNKYNNDNSNNLIKDRRLNFRKIGVGNYADLTKVFCTNFNPQFQSAFKSNPNIFKNYNGIFSKMYEDAARNGNIYKVFDKK